MPRLFTLLPFLFVLLCSTAFAQKPLSPVKFTTFRHPAPGYFLIGPNSTDSVALIDHSGQNVLATSASIPGTLLFADSTITHYHAASKPAFVRRNAHMVVIDTLRLAGNYELDFHDCHMLSNGNYVIMGIDKRKINMSGLTPGGDTAAQVLGAVFQERTLTGQTVFEWKSLDHIPVTEATEDIELFQHTIDYIHVNAIVKDADGNYLVSCRNLDEIVKVSRTNGSILWRLGGSKSRGNQFTFLNDNVGFTGFSHQHDVSRTSTGKLLLMDNGNLKTVPFSRAVEYEIDETLKTARMTWSYRATPDIFAPGMGSTQELENGNVLIGWGSTTGAILATEVSRDGTIQAEFTAADRPLALYRVRKAVFAMSGSERTIAAPGSYEFRRRDSSTRITLDVTRADAPTSIITERHSVPPHNLSFAGAAPCTPLPMRWVVRISDTSKVAGNTLFDVGSISMVIVPTRIVLYHRPKEGEGMFSVINAPLMADGRTLRLNALRAGEYALAFPMCYDPTPSLPVNGVGQISTSPTLAWTEAVQTQGYDVELYLKSNPSPLASFTTFRLDTTVSGLAPGQTYTWRVRARRDTPGPWSTLSTFHTSMAAPIASEPNSLPDSIAVGFRPTFKWSSVPAATSYRLQVFETDGGVGGGGVLRMDTVLVEREFTPSKSFAPNTWYRWRVRAQIDTIGGDWSADLFYVTLPAAPLLVAPASEALGIDALTSDLTWQNASGALHYEVQIFEGVSAHPLNSSELEDLHVHFDGLRPATRYYWRVRTIGRYGTSEWSAKRWFLTAGSMPLATTVLISPVNIDNVDTINTAFSWVAVDGATAYHMELTSKPTFNDPEYLWLDISESSKTVPVLKSGHAYRWRVLAVNADATSTWTSTGKFTAAPGPGDLLRPLTPIDSSIDVPAQFFGTFITDPRYVSYRAEFSTSPLFAEIAHAISGSMSPLPFVLAEGNRYWWRVIGTLQDNSTDTGAISTFTTVNPTSVLVPVSATHQTQISVQGSDIHIKGHIGGCRLHVYDVLGRLLRSSVVPIGADNWILSMSGLPSTAHILVVEPTFNRGPSESGSWITNPEIFLVFTDVL